MDGKFTDSITSPSDPLEGAHAHAINTRPSFLPRGTGLEATHTYGVAVLYLQFKESYGLLTFTHMKWSHLRFMKPWLHTYNI